MSVAGTSARSSLFTAVFMFGSSVTANTPRCVSVATIPLNVSSPVEVPPGAGAVRSQLTCALGSPGAVIVKCFPEIESETLEADTPVYCTVNAFGKTKYWCDTEWQFTSNPASIHDWNVGINWFDKSYPVTVAMLSGTPFAWNIGNNGAKYSCGPSVNPVSSNVSVTNAGYCLNPRTVGA